MGTIDQAVRDYKQYPSLKVGSNFIPYEDLQIPGRYPRDVGIPDDAILAYAAMGGLGPKKATVARFDDKDNLLVNVASGGGSGGGLGNIDVFVAIAGQAESAISDPTAHGPFTPTLGIVGVYFWAVMAAQQDEWCPIYQDLHIGPNGDASDPVLAVLSTTDFQGTGGANPFWCFVDTYISFNGYLNKGGTWKNTPLHVYLEGVYPGFGWLDGAGATVYYV